MSQHINADLVIGVDFGTTHTSRSTGNECMLSMLTVSIEVAWTNFRNEVVTIREWPGQTGSFLVEVPSKLQYGPSEKVKNWGFLCNDEETVDRIREGFKLYLDQDAIEVARRNGTSDVPENTKEAIHLVSDYLQQVYCRIKSSIEARDGPWVMKNVEFIFSCPSTWQAQSTMNNFQEAIRAAGFANETPYKHTAKLGLTSAEAVAVYVVSSHAFRFSDGDILLVCNAGGATTEVVLLEVSDINHIYPCLKEVAPVTGVSNGSVSIDLAFQKLVQRKLDLYRSEDPTLDIYGNDSQILNHQGFAMRLARSKAFQLVKHNFGTEAEDVTEYGIALHNLDLGITRDFCQPALRIDKGRMIFSR